MAILPAEALGTGDDATIWHYTTDEGFLGILDRGELWCTSILCMNDAKEVVYPLSILTNCLEQLQFPVTKTQELFAQILLRDLQHFSFQFSSGNVFTVSFCQKGDVLSQWRGYSSGGGFAIGFSPSELRSIGTLHGFKLVKCTYQKDEHERLVSIFVRDCFHLLDESGVSIHDLEMAYKTTQTFGPLRTLLNDIVAAFLQMSPSFKNPAFEQEHEWRLVSVLKDPAFNRKLVKVRKGRFSLATFVPFPLTSDCVRAVIVGPAREQGLNFQAACELLWGGGKWGAKGITSSAIPYRE